MNTEVIQRERGENILKLPSIGGVLNNIRYLLSASLLAFSILGAISLINLNNLTTNSAFLLIFLLLCGWFLAITPINSILLPFKEQLAKKTFELKIILHIFLTVLWLVGWFMGFVVLYAVGYAILK
ncbi:Uncharacterised protein [uncultured archaeon]|nr:Uncharacterised protein [uncultured archaeon]